MAGFCVNNENSKTRPHVDDTCVSTCGLPRHEEKYDSRALGGMEGINQRKNQKNNLMRTTAGLLNPVSSADKHKEAIYSHSNKNTHVLECNIASSFLSS